MWVGDVVWSSIPELTKPLKVMAKIRYNMPAAPAKVFPTEREDQVRVVFDQPVRAITPGQIAVFYRGETVVGGGTILAPNQIEVDSETTEQAVKRALQRVQPFMLEGAIE